MSTRKDHKKCYGKKQAAFDTLTKYSALLGCLMLDVKDWAKPNFLLGKQTYTSLLTSPLEMSDVRFVSPIKDFLKGNI